MLSYRTYGLLLYLFIFIFQVKGQESGSPVNVQDEDTINMELIHKLEGQLISIRNQAARNRESLLIMIDSLYEILEIKEKQIEELEIGYKQLEKDFVNSKEAIRSNNNLILDTREDIKNIAVILAIVFSVLIILTIVLYFVAHKNQNDRIEQKLAALRKYTISEMEDAESSFKVRLKKSIKKIRKTVLVESEKVDRSLKESRAERAAFKDVSKRLKAIEQQKPVKKSAKKKK